MTEESTGKFWMPFPPVSASPGSFGVTPSGDPADMLSIPTPALPKIELPRMRLPPTAGLYTPTLAEYAMMFPSPGPMPPIMLLALPR